MTKIQGMDALDRDVFIRELSIETGYTIQDTRKFLEGFQKIFVKAILAKAPLSIRGLGHLTFVEIQERRGFNARAYRLALKENPNADREDFYQIYPPVIRINFKLAANLRDLLRSPDKKKIKRK